MVDILPEDTPLWQSMETAALEVAARRVVRHAVWVIVPADTSQAFI